MINSSTFFAILSTIFFAAQHPFSKPATTNDYSVLFFLFYSSVVGLTIGNLIILSVIPKGFIKFFQLLRERDNIKRIFLLSVLNILSIYIYYETLSITNILLFSLMLNTTPLWGAIIDKLVNKEKKIPSSFWTTTLIALLIISIPAIGYKYEEMATIEFSYLSFLALLVPGFFVLSRNYSVKWFKQKNNDFIPNVASAIAGTMSSIVIIVLYIYLLQIGKEQLPSFFNTSLFLIGIGNLCIIIGSALFVRSVTLSTQSGKSLAYVTTINLFIPSFTILISYTINQLLYIPALLIGNVEIMQALLLFIVLFLFLWKNQKKDKNENY